MKIVTVLVLGLVLWALGLVWPEISREMTDLAGLNGWLIGGCLLVAWLWFSRSLARSGYVHQPESLAEPVVFFDPAGLEEQTEPYSLHSRPTRPIPTVRGSSRPSRPTRPMPTV